MYCNFSNNKVSRLSKMMTPTVFGNDVGTQLAIGIKRAIVPAPQSVIDTRETEVAQYQSSQPYQSLRCCTSVPVKHLYLSPGPLKEGCV